MIYSLRTRARHKVKESAALVAITSRPLGMRRDASILMISRLHPKQDFQMAVSDSFNRSHCDWYKSYRKTNSPIFENKLSFPLRHAVPFLFLLHTP